MNITGRVVQIAGSCHRDTSPDLARYSHTLVKELTRSLIERGARLLAETGDEPPIVADSKLSVVFFWTIFDAIDEALSAGLVSSSSGGAPILVVVSTTKALAKIPTNRRARWDRLVSQGAVQLQFLEPGWSAGGIQRTTQASLGDILVVLGGAEGVEHLAQLYAADGKPVIPLDIPIKGSTGSSTLGAPRLAQQSLTRPSEFAAVLPQAAGAAAFASLSCHSGSAPVQEVVQRLLGLIDKIKPPTAFYVRLLDKSHSDHPAVESYFRRVVDPFVARLGYSPMEMGATPHPFVWINEAIFKSIRSSGLVVADLTGMRPNCMLELGFAFGGRKRVLVTAMAGTALPFDLKPYECHIWKDPAEASEVEELQRYYERNGARPPP